jgi:hypothetical protein
MHICKQIYGINNRLCLTEITGINFNTAVAILLSGNADEQSGLTYDALRRHDVLQTNNIQKTPVESSMDSMSESGLTSISFASDWSSCSNKSFDK